ncbi:hypothetical protein V5799_019501 [Amblyomma americanum]|uniref:Sulfotransferase domain-containing protein n=1 Tax=Amblyomma americanum TaxID=6943 RepID=A0AAQ4EX75_AMBAM
MQKKTKTSPRSCAECLVPVLEKKPTTRSQPAIFRSFLEIPARPVLPPAALQLSGPSRLTMGHSLDKVESPHYLEVDGLLFPRSFSRDNVQYATRMRPDDGDVVIAGYPNSGGKTVATLLHLMARASARNPAAPPGAPPPQPFSGTASVPRAPAPAPASEASLVVDAPLIEWMGKEPLVYSNASPRRYIYLLRNPKDCCAHAFEDAVAFPQDYDFCEGRFDDFLELFVRGAVHGNDYFDHALSWWAHRAEPHLLCLVFEDLRMESRAHVERVLSFVGWREAFENSRNVALMQEVLEHIAKGPAHSRIMEVCD